MEMSEDVLNKKRNILVLHEKHFDVTLKVIEPKIFIHTQTVGFFKVTRIQTVMLCVLNYSWSDTTKSEKIQKYCFGIYF